MIDTDVEAQAQSETLIPNADILVSSLKNEPSAKERQLLINNVFTEQRREQILTKASVDLHGRAVRYYRHMDADMLLTFLKKCTQQAVDFNEDTSAPVDTHHLIRFLQTYGELKGTPNLDTNDLELLLKKIFPHANPNQLQNILASPTYENILPFMANTIEEPIARKMHAMGGMLKMFLPYLSLSVGGITGFPIEHAKHPKAYVEMVIPDSQVYPTHKARSEKEVVTKILHSYDISKVYVTDQEILDDIIANEKTPIGKYYQKYGMTNAISRWRSEPTEDYLPISFLTTS